MGYVLSQAIGVRFSAFGLPPATDPNADRRTPNADYECARVPDRMMALAAS